MSKPKNYYNDNDKKICAWIRALIREGLIPPGDVDDRSITEIKASDLEGYVQCHFFCGIAGWVFALQLAGWPADRPVWTGSCPCPPFSVANLHNTGAKGQGDSRHLWPVWNALIAQCLPPTVIGEQVGSAIGWGWYDEVGSDLEKHGYAIGASILPACEFGADHERKRLFWVADASGERWEGHQPVECFSFAEAPSFSIPRHYFTDARRAMDGDFGHLLFSNGVSLQLERDALKGFGNAICPIPAAEFIRAFIEIEPTP